MSRLPYLSSLHKVSPNSSDNALIEACLKGEALAWDTLIQRYAALIYSVGIRMGLSDSDKEDVFQDVCLILMNHLGNLRDVTKLSSWLISTTKREAWRLQRRRGVKLASELGEGEWEMESAEGIHTQKSGSPETEFIALEEQQMMREAMARLQDRCRRLLTLLYGVDSPPSYVEIAAEFSLPIGSIGPTRARCLQHLKKLLTKIGY